MSNPAMDKDVARRVGARTTEVLDVLGPTIQFLSSDEREHDPCIMRSIVPPGVTVPLHSHPEPETFIALAGRIEALKESAGNFEWVSIGPGDVFHVPGGVKHAIPKSIERTGQHHRSRAFLGRQILSGNRHAGRSGCAAAGAAFGQGDSALPRDFRTYGYWNATPEANARIGIFLGPPV